jgi:hypothetical protein
MQSELKTWSETWNSLYKRVQSHQVFARVLLISTARGWCLRHSLLGSSKGDKAKQLNLDEMLPTLIGVTREPAKSTIISQLSKDFSALRDSKRSSAIDKSFKYFENKCSEVEPNDEMVIDQDHFGESRNPFVEISQSPTHKSRSLAQSSVDLPVSPPPSSAVSQSQNNTNVMSRLNRSLDLPNENSSPIRPQHQPRSTPPINPPTLPRTEHIQVVLPKEDRLASIQMDIDIELSLPKELSEVNLDMLENDLFEDMTLTKSPKTKPSQVATKSPKTPAAKSKKTPTKSKSNNNRESSAEEIKAPAEKESEEKKDDSASVEIVLKKNTKSKTTPKSNTKNALDAKSNSDEKKFPVKSPAQKSKAKSPKPKPKNSAKKSPASKKQSAKKEESDDSASEKSENDQSKKDSESEKSEKSDSSKSKKSSRDEKSEQSAIKSSEESSKRSASRKASQKSESSDDSDSDEKSSSSKSSAKSSSSKSSSSSAKSSSSSKSKKSASASEKSNKRSSSRKSDEESDKEKSEKSESSSEKWATKKSKKTPPKKKPRRSNGSTNAKKKSAKKKKPVAKKRTKADDEEKSDENKKSNEESNVKTKGKKSNKNNAKESVSDEKTTSTNTKKTPTKDDDTKKPAAKETAPKAKKSKKNSLAKKEVDELPSAELIEEEDTRQSDNLLAPAPLKSNTALLRTLSGLSQAITGSLDLPFSQDTIDLTVSTDVNGSVDGDCVVLSAQGPIDDDFQLTGSKRKRNDGQNMKPNKRSKAALGKVNTVQEITD